MVLAFSNGISASLKVKPAVKRDLFRDVIYPSKSRLVGELRVFSALLYLLLAPHLEQLELITIDTEYPGHDADIRGMFLNHVRAGGQSIDKKAVDFGRIGKHSSAHKLAYAVYKCKVRETLLVRIRDVERLLR